jgi:hypothetical protein
MRGLRRGLIYDNVEYERIGAGGVRRRAARGRRDLPAQDPTNEGRTAITLRLSALYPCVGNLYEYPSTFSRNGNTALVYDSTSVPITDGVARPGSKKINKIIPPYIH